MPITSDVQTAQQLKNNFKNEFLSQNDVPYWFCGTSIFQVIAADELLHALRDDTEQNTTHRVRACLACIGINPLVTKKEIRTLMRLSRGNDLAFLWFLMELNYKTPGDTYSLNEQLIMSSIAHLDMITTLRELDRILPPGPKSLKEKKTKERQKREKVKKPFVSKYVLPYFDRLVSKQHYGKELLISVPAYKVRFGKYEKYTDSSHSVQNENNRWYEHYNLKPGHRIANRIICDEVQNLFNDFAKVALNVDKVQTLCGHHTVIKELEESLAHELRVTARDRCLKYLDVDGKNKEASKKRVMEQLDKDIAAEIRKFRKAANKMNQQQFVHLLFGHEGCETYLVDDMINDDTCNPLGHTVEEQEDRENFKSDKAECGDDLNTSENVEPKHNSFDINYVLEHNNQIKERVSTASDMANPHSSNILSFQQKHFSHCNRSSHSIPQKFFVAPAEHTPLQFDYRSIFRFKQNNEKNVDIKKAFVEAILSDIEQLYRLKKEKLNADDAVKISTRTVWNEQVAFKNNQISKEQRLGTSIEKKKNKSPLNYNQESYDPNDKVLMKKMLKDAFEFMRKNPKFVLATFPGVHKLPLFREWIYQRYGKFYSQKERDQSFAVSQQLFAELNKINMDVRMPKHKDLGHKLFIKYSCREYLLRKKEYIEKKAHDRLNHAIMKQARVLFFSMRPYLCTNGPPIKTYYAYMPSRDMDIKYFALWKPNEFVNMKDWFEKRMSEMEKQNKY